MKHTFKQELTTFVETKLKLIFKEWNGDLAEALYRKHRLIYDADDKINSIKFY